MLKLTVDNLDEVIDSIVDDRAIERALQKACALTERKAKEKAPKDTGALRQSITSKVEKEDGEWTGTVYTPLEYAPYVEYGTGLFAEGGNGRKDVPWYIPLGGDFTKADAEKYHMPITGKEGGQQWAMSWGQHAANDGHGFMRPALNEAREDIIRFIKEAVVDD